MNIEAFPCNYGIVYMKTFLYQGWIS